MFNTINWLGFNTLILFDPILLPGFQNKLVLASNFFYWMELHVTMTMSSGPKMNPNGFSSISLTRLCCRPKMLTKSHFSRSGGNPNVLGSQPAADTSILDTLQAVHYTWGGADDAGVDCELLPRVIAGVGVGVT